MPLKDYYQILRLEAGVDKSAIKRAYRKLAMQYHPDKQKESTGSNSYFHDIQEAYEILSNPDKREQYHYERWLEHSMGNRMEGEMPAHQIIQLIIKADQHLSGTDKFRLDSYILLNHLLKLFSPAKIETILNEHDITIEKTFIETAIRLSENLNSSCELQLKERFENLLKKHSSLDIIWRKQIDDKKIEEKINRITLPLILFFVVLSCIIFYMLSKK